MPPSEKTHLLLLLRSRLLPSRQTDRARERERERERKRERKRERLILKGAEKSPDETNRGYQRHNSGSQLERDKHNIQNRQTAISKRMRTNTEIKIEGADKSPDETIRG